MSDVGGLCSCNEKRQDLMNIRVLYVQKKRYVVFRQLVIKITLQGYKKYKCNDKLKHKVTVHTC